MSQASLYTDSCQESTLLNSGETVSPTSEKNTELIFANDESFMITKKPYEECTKEEQLERRYFIIFLSNYEKERERQGLKKLYTNDMIFEIANVSRSTGYRWIQQENKNPGSGLLLINSAPKTDKKSKLNCEQKEEIKIYVKDSLPHEHNINASLWSRRAIKELIYNKYGILLTKKAISKWLRKENFVFRRPAKYELKRSQEKIDTFTSKTFKLLQKKYKGYRIFFMDETHNRQDSSHERGLSPRGKAPILSHTLGISAHSVATIFIAMANNGEMVYSIESCGSSNAKDVIMFLKTIQRKFKNEKILIIADNARIHHAKIVKRYLKNKRNIKIEFLPPYAPDINPVELLNQVFKKVVRLSDPMTKEELIDFAYDFFDKMESDPEAIKKFFTSEKTSYAQAS